MSNRVDKVSSKIVFPKMQMHTVDGLTYFTDPDGNIHRAYQDDPKANKVKFTNKD